MGSSHFLVKYSDFSKKNVKNVSLNFGPQHPAAHGVLRLILNLNSEVINCCDPHIGLLHRGTEKLIENKMYLHAMPYFDRLDYVSTIVQENVYCTAVDKLKKINYNSYSLITRTIYDELTRILNHLLAISCHALDVGSMSTIFWAFEEREKIMEFYERFSGARMHTALYKPIIFEKILSKKLIGDIMIFTKTAFVTLNEMHNVLTNNKVWKTRLVNIAPYNIYSCINNNLTGVMARSCGLKRDLRLNSYTSYNNYKYINFYSYTTYNGDCYDRYILRMYEMIESSKIINQSCVSIYKIKYKNSLKKINFYKKKYMESVIDHFKYWSSGFKVDNNIINVSVESPKGEFSVSLLSDSTEKPYRCKIKSPSYSHLQFIKYVSRDTFLADLVTIIGTIDIVFGEIDR